jgi:hypothetical protein
MNDKNLADEADDGLSYEGKRICPNSGSAVVHISQM